MIYPSAEKIIEFNLLSISMIRVKKADEAKVLSKSKIYDIVEELNGNVYDKAINLV